MLQRVWSCCCCCCPGGAASGAAGSGGGGGNVGGHRTGSYTPLANDLVLQLSQSPRSERMSAMDAHDDTFEIEIDEQEEEEDDEDQLESMRALDAGGAGAGRDGDSARFLREVEMLSRGGYAAASNGSKSGAVSPSPLPRTATGRTPVTLLQPPPSAYSYPAAPAASSSGDGSAITSDDLEVGETDADIQRFKEALNRAENAMRAEKAARISPTAATTAAAAALPAIPPAAASALRPAPVQLPQNHGAATGPGFGSGSIAARAADAPVRSVVPLIPGPVQSSALPTVRKSKSHAASAARSVPTTPVLAVRPGAPHVQPSPQQPQAVQPVNGAAEMHAPKPASVHPSQTDHLQAPQVQSIVHSSNLVHSPSAPSLSSGPRAALPFVPPAVPALVVQEAPKLVQEEKPVQSVPAPAAGVAAPAKPVTGAVAPATASASPAAPARKQPGAVAATGNPLDRLGVPGGVISAAHMEGVMSMLKGGPASPSSDGASAAAGSDLLAADVSYAHLFAFLHAVSRTLPGKVVRPFVVPELQAIIAAHKGDGGKSHGLKRSASQSMTSSSAAAASSPSKAAGGVGLEAAKLLLSFLHWLRDIRIDTTVLPHTLTIRLDFGSDADTKGNYAYVDQPSQATWVLSSKHPRDPWLFHPSNTPKIYKNESHKLCVHKEIVMTFDEKGIKGVRSGDVSIKKFVSFNADLRTEYRPGMVEYDDKKNAFIQMSADDDSKPIIVDGRYQPRTFDYWLVVTVLKQENWVGLPVIGKSAPPDLNMKPHAGYAYP